jgi:hypothetical protein
MTVTSPSRATVGRSNDALFNKGAARRDPGGFSWGCQAKGLLLRRRPPILVYANVSLALMRRLDNPLGKQSARRGCTAIFRKHASRRVELGPCIVKCRRENRGKVWRDVF